MSMSQQLYSKNRKSLNELYKENKTQMARHHINVLAQMLTGVMLGRHVQLWMIALLLPFKTQLTSQVRKFERFLADERVDVKQYFLPFVKAMHQSLGNEVAYIILDCTKAGKKCRVLLAGLVYHGTVLPVCWKTYAGSKGHMTGEKHKKLLQELPDCFACYHRIVVLGDAEFGNKEVISWLQDKKWDFVFRAQKSRKAQKDGSEEWLRIGDIHEAEGVRKGQVKHWEGISYTETHQLEGLTLTGQWEEGYTEPIYLISSLPAGQAPHLVYEMRYTIETLFGNNKSRGFQLAKTHLTNPKKIDRLFLVLAIATCQVLGLGTHLVLTEGTDWIDRSERRDLSLFQLGFRYFMRLIALNRLDLFEMYFRWDFSLPEPGPQPAL